MKLCNLFENNSNMPGGRSHLKSISQEEDSSGIEGYIVDTVQVQLDNYLSSERAPPSLVSELRNKYSRIGIIKNIWVDDDQRSTGIGSGILETAIDEASDDGAQAILLVAQADDQQDQPKLVKWYESYGFSRIGVTSSGYPVLLLELDTDQSLSENFADGRGPGRPGDSQRHGIPKNATMAQLEKAARAPGRKGQLARWQINMRRGQKKESIAESGSSMIDNTKGWGTTPNPIIMGPGGSVIDGNHRAQAARELDQPIQAYAPMEKVDEEVWDKPNPRKKHKKLSTKQKAAARARAHRAGRPYPNLIDNMWASNCI